MGPNRREGPGWFVVRHRLGAACVLTSTLGADDDSLC